MKKIVSIVIAIILLVILFLLFFSRETTLKEEGFKVDSSKVNEIEIIRGTDDKTIFLKDDQAEELYNMLSEAKLKTNKSIDEEYTENYWIKIKEDGLTKLSMVIDDKLVLSPHDSDSNDGSKKNSQHYLLENDDVLNFIEPLFE